MTRRTIDGKPAGIVAVADPNKATTAEAINELHALGLEIVMLTADNRRTAAAVVKFFGLQLSPIIAGAAMSLSSVSVISNALRLRNVRL